jgi:cation transport regulator ChaC
MEIPPCRAVVMERRRDYFTVHMANRPRRFFFLSLLVTIIFLLLASSQANAFHLPSLQFRVSRKQTTAFSSSSQLNSSMSTEESTTKPTWCTEQQVWLNAVIPENAEVTSLLEKNNGYLRLFGYGSLCWNPGTGALAKPGVTGTLGKARGYKRCWAQRSTDHRGTPSFPGVVCTLLEDEEVSEIFQSALSLSSASAASDRKKDSVTEPTMTEGVIYLIPPDLVSECLDELDFREKGGYARDVIDVVEDETGETHQALLYRATPDNPGFWSRVLLDLPFSAGMLRIANCNKGKRVAGHVRMQKRV